VTSLPAGWTTAALTELVELNPRSFDSNPSDDDLVSFVPMASVQEQTGRLDATASRRWGAVKKGYTRFQDGDLLFAKITPCMENGKFALAKGLVGGRAAGSTEFHVIRSGAAIDARFLLHYLLREEVRRNARAQMKGAAGQLRVPPEYLRNLRVSLPPIREQHRIVTAIEEHLSDLDAAVAAFKRVQAQLPRYRAAVLRSACEGTLVDTAANQIATTLGELASVITSGSRGWASYYTDSGPLFIRAQDIKTDHLVIEDAAHVAPPLRAEGIRTRVKINDLLITITGANVTKSALVDRELGEAYVSQHVALVRLQAPAQARFVYHWLVAPSHGRRLLERDAYGAGKPGLNLSQLRALPVTLPSPQQQDTIVAEVERRLSLGEALAHALDSALARADRLRQAILKRAFEGKLVPQDSKDEPAHLLLQRIRSTRSGEAKPNLRQTGPLAS
jgi:type I restriction enzyme S subunit